MSVRRRFVIRSLVHSSPCVVVCPAHISELSWSIVRSVSVFWSSSSYYSIGVLSLSQSLGRGVRENESLVSRLSYPPPPPVVVVVAVATVTVVVTVAAAAAPASSSFLLLREDFRRPVFRVRVRSICCLPICRFFPASAKKSKHEKLV